MPNTILTGTKLTDVALFSLENHLTFAKYVNRAYSDEFQRNGTTGTPSGFTVQIRLPSVFTVRTGNTAVIQDVTQVQTPITFTVPNGVDVEITDTDLALSVVEFEKNITDPMMIPLANKIDKDGLALYKTVPNIVVAASTATYNDFLDAGALLADNGVPFGADISAVLSPRQQASLIKDTKTLFNNVTDIGEQYRTGNMGMAAGMKFSMDQNTPTHTVGAYGAGPINVDAVPPVEGATAVVVDGLAAVAGALKAGDIITMAGVNAVNVVDGTDLGYARQFVVTADVLGTATNCSVPVFPAFVSTGAGKTVSALPAGGALVTVIGTASATYREALVFHKDAFTLATVDLPLMNGMDVAKRSSDKQLGISMRFVRGFDITNNTRISRFDVFYAWAKIRSQTAVRVRTSV
jgi:hypothetical protein